MGELQAELEVSMAQVLAQWRVTDLLAIDDFVVPADEEVDDPAEDLTSHIVATIDTVDTESPDDIVNETPHTRVTHDSALSDADELIAYAEQQSTSDMRVLQSIQRVIQKRLAEFRRNRAQQTLDTWVK
jgi:tetrahydromethanopterin S-methyltransferase subunit A